MITEKIVRQFNKKIKRNLLRKLGCQNKYFFLETLKPMVSGWLIIFLLFQVITETLLLSPIKGVQADSDWLSGWQYRKQITITGQSGAATNYQVLFKIGESSGASDYHFHLEGHSQNFPSETNNSGDLRFTSSDGTTLLDFWVESVSGSSPNRIAKVWVKVRDNLDTNQNIYCYYGKSGAENVSSGENTFLTFNLKFGRPFDSGSTHTCALLSDGSAKCWGQNDEGQLGDGTNTNKYAPVSVSNLSNAVAISAGFSHTCAVLSDGSAKCWGWNDYGQLGDGTNTNTNTPVSVSNLSNAVAIAAGGEHTCALLSDGSAKCWGWNEFGQLGDGTNTDTNTPVSVLNLSNAVAISAGDYYTCALLSDGSVKCWGGNFEGHLGDGTNTNTNTPVSVLNLSNAVAISAGDYHACALLLDGSAKCWGWNFEGQLGNGTNTDTNTPVSVLNLSNAVAISAGDSHTCALLSDGSAKCWGKNNVGQLGDGTNTNKYTPVSVSNLSNAVTISVGYTHTCALLSDGSAKCWGENDVGQLGDGTNTNTNTPVSVLNVSNAVAISAGFSHTCALLLDGSAKCWGNNDFGQLGDGTNTNTNTPVSVLNLSNAVAISAGGTHTCAVLSDGSAKCWGKNNGGQLGDGTNTNTNTPVSVSNLSNAVTISVGLIHTCALLSDGSAKCWGNNDFGQLGDGTNTNTNTPVSVSNLSNAVAISAEFIHTCAVLSDGSAKCWGGNNFGQLGDGVIIKTNTPISVINYNLDGRYDKQNGIPATIQKAPYFEEIYFIRKYASLEPTFNSAGNEEEVVLNRSPNNPSSLGPANYVDGSWGNDNIPTLEFTQSDPDTENTVKYRIEIDDNADFSSPTVDYTSVLLAQGTTSFTVGQAAGGGIYTKGNEGQILADSTNYYWRVMSEDNHGATSSWITANSGNIAFKIDTVAPTNVGISSVIDNTANKLTITALTATDSLSGLHSSPYWFEEISGNPGASSSNNWQTSTNFIDDGLSANTLYTYQVKVRDAAGNESAFSTPFSKYTLANISSDLILISNSQTQIIASWQANNNPPGTEYFCENVTAGTNSDWITSLSWVSSNLTCGTTYSFRVKARNKEGVETDFVSEVSHSTQGCSSSVGVQIPSQGHISPTTPASGPRVLINNGAEYTDSLIVNLTLFGGLDVIRMAISNNPGCRDFDSTSQIPYQSSYQWNLCQGMDSCPEGEYIVCVKFFNSRGTASAAVSDSIIYKRKTEVSKEKKSVLQPSIIEEALEVFKPLIPEFLKPKPAEEIKPSEISIEELEPKEAPVKLSGKKQVLPLRPIKEFILIPILVVVLIVVTFLFRYFL